MENIKCQICALNFDQADRCPRLLPNCSHTLCQTCLEKLLEKMECPFCRQKFSSASVKDYPKNFIIYEACQSRVYQSELLCCNCCESDSEYACMDCNTFICHICVAFKHADHNLKNIKDLHEEMCKKLETRRDTMLLCKERANFFESVLEHLINKIKDDLITKTQDLIKSITEHQNKILKELDEIETRCKSRTNIKKIDFLLWNFDNIQTKNLLKYHYLNFEDWDIRARKYWAGDLFIESFKELAHLNLFWSDAINTSKVKDYFYIVPSNCEQSNCNSSCAKIDELSEISSSILNYRGILNSGPGLQSRKPKICNLISQKFLITDLEKFQYQYSFHKSKIDYYLRDCKIESYIPENIHLIKQINNSEVSNKICEYFKDTLKKVRKDDRKIALTPCDTDSLIHKIRISEEKSYLNFMFSILSNPDIKKFLMRSYTNKSDKYLNQAKKIIRTLTNSSNLSVSNEDVMQIFKDVSGKSLSKNDVILSYMKTYVFLENQIRKSRIKIKDKKKIIHEFTSKCPVCPFEVTANIPIIDLKANKFAKVQFTTYSQSKRIEFLIKSPCNVDDIKEQISKMTSIDASLLLILDENYNLTYNQIWSKKIYVYENILPFNEKTKLIKILLVNSITTVIYFIALEINHGRSSLQEKLFKIFGIYSYDYRNIEFESRKVYSGYSSRYENHEFIKNINSNPEIRINNYDFSLDQKFPITTEFPLSLITQYAFDSKCQNEKCNSSLNLISYPKTILAFISPRFKSINFKLGQAFDKNLPHKLKAVLTVSDNQIPIYTSYFVGLDKKHFKIQNVNSAIIDENTVIQGEPLILMYSSH